MSYQDYRDLEVWQFAMDLVKEIYILVRRLPRDEMYGLSDQMRRAAVSIPSNIAEGHGRISGNEFVHFLTISRGSLLELETQLELCKRLNFLSDDATQYSYSLIISIKRMLNALISHRLKIHNRK